MISASLFFAFATGAQGPCDITGAAGQPCVAAHSTVRALYGAYDGPLYNVTRTGDGQSLNIGVLKPGGFANVATHDAFCAKGDCLVSNIFDQSPQKNHLKQRHKLVNASQHPIHVRDGEKTLPCTDCGLIRVSATTKTTPPGSRQGMRKNRSTP